MWYGQWYWAFLYLLQLILKKIVLLEFSVGVVYSYVMLCLFVCFTTVRESLLILSCVETRPGHPLTSASPVNGDYRCMPLHLGKPLALLLHHAASLSFLKPVSCSIIQDFVLFRGCIICFCVCVRLSKHTSVQYLIVFLCAGI